MKKHNKKIIYTILGLWIVLIGGFIGWKEYTLQMGTEVLLETRPVDPRDFFRGDYVILSYDISSFDMLDYPELENIKNNQTIFVSLEVDQENIATYKNVGIIKPVSGLYIRGRAQKNERSNSLDVHYGIESYFVEEGTGREIEQQLDGTKARIKINTQGYAVLEGIILPEVE